MQVNGVFPHRLAEAAQAMKAYVIHFSSDGVFSGRRGYYSETDRPDPHDLYGRSKLLGELDAPHCITLRTTFYGVFSTGAGLLNWFLSATPDQWRGYADYVFSPLSVRRLAAILAHLIERDDRLHGIHHAGAAATTKLQLLELVRDTLGLQGQIMPVAAPVVDRSLDSTRFWRLIGHPAPSHREMIEAMRPQLIRAVASSPVAAATQ
jgi:dTDP-4-dehydrorhamnose reductase